MKPDNTQPAKTGGIPPVPVISTSRPHLPPPDPVQQNLPFNPTLLGFLQVVSYIALSAQYTAFGIVASGIADSNFGFTIIFVPFLAVIALFGLAIWLSVNQVFSKHEAYFKTKPYKAIKYIGAALIASLAFYVTRPESVLQADKRKLIVPVVLIAYAVQLIIILVPPDKRLSSKIAKQINIDLAIVALVVIGIFMARIFLEN